MDNNTARDNLNQVQILRNGDVVLIQAPEPTFGFLAITGSLRQLGLKDFTSISQKQSILPEELEKRTGASPEYLVEEGTGKVYVCGLKNLQRLANAGVKVPGCAPNKEQQKWAEKE